MKNKPEAEQLALIGKVFSTHTNLKRNPSSILDHNFNFVITGRGVGVGVR